MKKILFTAVSALAVAGVAVAADSTEFGVLTVPSSAKETIVSVPWLESGTTDSAVSVSNLVLTSGLKVGDQLMYYKGASEGYVSWVIAQDTSSGPKYWTPGNVVLKDAVVFSSGASDKVTIPRGGAVILRRAEPETCFYIMGKPATVGVQTNLGAGYSLIAPPSVADTDVNTGLTWSGIVTGDQLIIPDGDKLVTLSWKVKTDFTGWRKWDETKLTWIQENIKIPAGKGAWFVNSGNTTKTVEWASAK